MNGIQGGTGPVSPPPPPPPKPEQQVLQELHALQGKREGAAAANMPIDEATLAAYHLDGVRSATELHALVDIADDNQDGKVGDDEFDRLYEKRFEGQYDAGFDLDANLRTQYDATRTVLAPTAMTDLDAATAKYQDLKGQVEAANGELARDMARFGNALTPAQQIDYIQKFKDTFTVPGADPQHPQKLFDAYKVAEGDLATTLSTHADAFAALMNDHGLRSESLHQQVLDAYKEIAKSPDPEVAAKALPFARMAMDPTLVPKGTDMKAFGDFADQIRTQVYEPASVAKATVDVKNGKDPAEAIEEQQGLAQKLAEAWEATQKDKKLVLSVTKGMTAMANSAKATVGAVKDALAGKSAKAVEALEGSFEAAEPHSAGRGLAVLGLVGAAASLAAKTQSKASQDLLDATKSLLTTAKEGGELVENILKVSSGLAGEASTLGQPLAKAAEGAGNMMKRLAPMLGISIGVMGAMQKARDGKWLGVAAELGGSVAAVLTSTVVGAPVGILLQCGCTLLSMLDDTLAAGDRLSKDSTKAQGVLQAVLAAEPALHGVDAATRNHLADVLAHNTKDHMAQLTTDLGLTAHDIQQLGVSGYADSLVGASSSASDDAKYVGQLQTLMRPRSPKDPGASVDLGAFLTSVPMADRATVMKGLADLYQDLLGSWGYQHPNAAGPAQGSATWFRNAVKDYARDPNLMFRDKAQRAADYLDRYIDEVQAPVLHGH
ncbi:MAG: hypothetical protein JWM80_3323 [Cyanobacteria bacterium RYN_339]|nr:hypothetical protein [Cyanobacteria bacterium RYN_339]